MQKPFKIKITNISELRMGSSYRHCAIELVNYTKGTLPRVGWQDKYAWSDDFKKLVLIMWDTTDNEPGFRLFFIDIDTGDTQTSPRIFGLPNTISIDDGKVKFNKSLYRKEQSESGKLCCHTDDEYHFI